MERRDFLKLGLAGVGTMALADNAWALKYYPRPSDKKCAVLYGTWYGSSRDAAVWISEGMGGIADVFDVREKPDLKGFDHIVIGGSIQSMATPKELQDYITKNKGWLQSKVRGLFAVCGNGERPVGPQQTTMFIDNHLAKLCEVNDIPSRVFNGRITKSLMEPEVAKMMEEMYPQIAGKPLADYDLLKRADCMAFGKEILNSITP
ncbi:MAG: twin-arginine translocation signal domain-containing protein [Deltaproteobacteria bacterium]|nr:twin-arginine translocation signal domain-containing protein [Deltaproteobacteria bacterium]